MQNSKKIKFTVRREENYGSISPEEIRRIKTLLTIQIVSIANRFDGPSTFTLQITAKGNA